MSKTVSSIRSENKKAKSNKNTKVVRRGKKLYVISDKEPRLKRRQGKKKKKKN